MNDRDELEPVTDDAGTELLFFADEFGLLVHGPEDLVQATIDRLLDGEDPGPGARQRLSPGDAVAIGVTGVALTATSGEYLRLTAKSAAKVQKFGPQFDASGAMRGWVRDGNQFAGQLTFEPVSLAAEQALALQTAAVSLALRSAIADVQKAVEEVADKVDDIRKHLRARLQGDVIGTYRHLREVAEQANRRGRLLEADWDSVAGVRNQLYRDLDTLRGYVRAEVKEVTLDLSVPAREKRFRRFVFDPGSVADVLRLILVTEQSLQLFEYLRLQRVRDRDSAHVESAVEDARSSLLTQHEHDDQLVSLMLAAIDRTRVVEALEVHHVFTKDALDTQARAFHQQVVAFAESSRTTRPDDLGAMPRAGLTDARDELRERAVVTGRAARALGSAAAAGGTDLLRRGGHGLGEQVRTRTRRTNEEAPPEEEE